VLMNLFKLFSLLCLITTCTAAQDCKATVVVSSDIENTEYFLNNLKAGEGKDAVIQTDTGRYILTAVESGNLWNPLTFSDTINIVDCGEYKFNFSFSSVLYLNSEPTDAYVFRNDSLLGNTPIYVNRGLIPLKLSKAGYREVEISDNDLLNKVSLEETGRRNGKSFYERSIFKYLIGGLLVLGGTSAYFKLEADKSFDHYQLTGNESSLKDTRRNDLISGITFGALQINFGILLYYFLSE
jgi:hypothetical protein